ncbi:MAG: lecithin retinol acyltransferase family protein [Treponemataceae bacterium]|jgi:hypothetical protein|nr:lecithin retinol acyltransferase family protein [Treponemataceae bacterium]
MNNISNLINKPLPGDVLSVDRGLYKHYGVYVGNNTVVHFSGGSEHELSVRNACIRKTTLDDFCKDGEVQIEANNAKSYSRKETVMRALNAVGSEKGKYSLFWNNCEHFANWCRYGKKHSAQVEQFATNLAEVSLFVLGTIFIKNLVINRPFENGI